MKVSDHLMDRVEANKKRIGELLLQHTPLTQKQLYYHVTSSEQLATKVASYFFKKP